MSKANEQITKNDVVHEESFEGRPWSIFDKSSLTITLISSVIKCNYNHFILKCNKSLLHLLFFEM